MKKCESVYPGQPPLRLHIELWSTFTLFHLLIDLQMNIPNRSANIVDLKSGILKPSKTWMVCQRSIKLEHLPKLSQIAHYLGTHFHTFSSLDRFKNKYSQ